MAFFILGRYGGGWTWIRLWSTSHGNIFLKISIQKVILFSSCFDMDVPKIPSRSNSKVFEGANKN